MAIDSKFLARKTIHAVLSPRRENPQDHHRVHNSPYPEPTESTPPHSQSPQDPF
jgi:hypothetical protein